MSEREQCQAILDGMTDERISGAFFILELLNTKNDVTVTLPVASADICGVKHNFNNTIYVLFTAGEYYTMEYTPYNIFVTGDTVNEVRDEFFAALDFVYREYALCPDDELTEDALQLKARLLHDVG